MSEEPEPAPSGVPRVSGRQKGLEYERAFAEFMRAHLGFSTVHEHELKRGADILRPYECDLLGIKHSNFYRALEWGSTAILLSTVVIMLAAVFGDPDSRANAIKTALEGMVADFVPADYVAHGLIVPMVVATCMGFVGERRTTFVAMVECRDRKAKVRKNYVAEVATRKRQILASKQAKKPTETWIVSSSGFDQDALSLATAERIHCISFQKTAVAASLVNRDLPSRVFR